MAALAERGEAAGEPALGEHAWVRLQKNIDNDTLVDVVAKREQQRWAPPKAAGGGKHRRAKDKRSPVPGGADEAGSPTDPPSALAPVLPWLRRPRPGEPLPVVGLDFGKVISGGANDEAVEGSAATGGGGVTVGADNVWFSDRFLETPAVPGALAGVATLVAALGSGRVFVVSKAHGQGRARTLEWLAAHDVYGRTGLSPTHVFFTRNKSDKAVVCRFLGITAFVDDSADVLSEMAKPAPQRPGSGGGGGGGGSQRGGKAIAAGGAEAQVPLRLLLKAAPGLAAAAACERERDANSGRWTARDRPCPVFRWSELVAVLTGDEALLRSEADTGRWNVVGSSAEIDS